MGLCLTRKHGQSFTIGETITVRILEARAGKARLEIEAPDHIPILRSELVKYGHPQDPPPATD